MCTKSVQLFPINNFRLMGRPWDGTERGGGGVAILKHFLLSWWECGFLLRKVFPRYIATWSFLLAFFFLSWECLGQNTSVTLLFGLKHTWCNLERRKVRVGELLRVKDDDDDSRRADCLSCLTWGRADWAAVLKPFLQSYPSISPCQPCSSNHLFWGRGKCLILCKFGKNKI